MHAWLHHMHELCRTRVHNKLTQILLFVHASDTSTQGYTGHLYSKALRCTFLGDWKNSCSSKFVQLELVDKAKVRTSKNRAGFQYVSSCISNFFWPFSKACIVKVRAAWDRVSRGLTVVDLGTWFPLKIKLDSICKSDNKEVSSYLLCKNLL